MKDSFEVEQRLAEAIAWCSLKVNLSHVDRCLRTPLLCPPLLQGDGDEFDLADVPAWDSWFWHRRTGVLGGLVYSWVPGALTDLVSSGIECMPVESSWWVDSFEGLGD